MPHYSLKESVMRMRMTIDEVLAIVVVIVLIVCMVVLLVVAIRDWIACRRAGYLNVEYLGDCEGYCTDVGEDGIMHYVPLEQVRDAPLHR
jgi:hypothetical protein